MIIKTIISGGQTGVDRAALDTAIELDIPHAGWCPAGRRAEDGRIPDHYQLRETPDKDYLQRTEWNVRDSDATLIISPDQLKGGTAATHRFAVRHNKPCIIMDPNRVPDTDRFRRWLQQHSVQTLNIAGPRESKQPGIYRQSREYLHALLTEN